MVVMLAALLSAFIVSTPRSSCAGTTVKLIWTTPGDNGGLLPVSLYDLRLSTHAISGSDTLSWWMAATKIDMAWKVPKMPALPDTALLGGLMNGTRYYAILRSADRALNWSGFSNLASFTPGAITGIEDGDNAPALVVGSPRPSPTSGRTDVSLDLPASMTVVATVYDAQGRLARRLESGMLNAGSHLLRWDGMLEGGGQAASGVYWIRVAAGKLDKRVKLVVVR
jgi:hypothetical protein